MVSTAIFSLWRCKRSGSCIFYDFHTRNKKQKITRYNWGIFKSRIVIIFNYIYLEFNFLSHYFFQFFQFISLIQFIFNRPDAFIKLFHWIFHLLWPWTNFEILLLGIYSYRTFFRKFFLFYLTCLLSLKCKKRNAEVWYRTDTLIRKMTLMLTYFLRAI